MLRENINITMGLLDWFHNQSQTNTDKTTVNLNGDNNTIQLHEEHLLTSKQIKLGLEIIIFIILAVIFFYVMKKCYKAHKQNNEIKNEMRLRELNNIIINL